MLVDGTPRHVKNVQCSLNTNPLASSGSGESSNDIIYIYMERERERERESEREKLALNNLQWLISQK